MQFGLFSDHEVLKATKVTAFAKMGLPEAEI